MNPALVNLPWTVLLTLASGYAGYFIAHVGVREHHKTVDVTFGTLVFGFMGAFSYELCVRVLETDIFSASLASFVTAVLVGAVWSRWLRGLMHICLRASGVTHSDDLPTAWVSLFRQTSLKTFQLSVKLQDGTWLKCDDLRKFEHSPNGPCVLGGAGDILMYVTHVKSPTDEEFEEIDGVQDVEWGEEITFIPRGQIARVDLRRRR